MLVAKTSSESRGFLDNHHWSLFVPKSFRKTYRCPSKGRKGYVDRRFIWKRCIKFSHTIQVCKFTFQCNAGARCIVDLAEVSLGSNDEVQPPVPSYWKAAIRELPTNIIRVERNLFSNLQALPAGLMWVGTVIIESCGLWSTKTRSFLQRGLYYPSTGSVGLCTALKRLILHSKYYEYFCHYLCSISFVPKRKFLNGPWNHELYHKSQSYNYKSCLLSNIHYATVFSASALSELWIHMKGYTRSQNYKLNRRYIPALQG